MGAFGLREAFQPFVCFLPITNATFQRICHALMLWQPGAATVPALHSKSGWSFSWELLRIPEFGVCIWCISSMVVLLSYHQCEAKGKRFDPCSYVSIYRWTNWKPECQFCFTQISQSYVAQIMAYCTKHEGQKCYIRFSYERDPEDTGSQKGKN